MLIVGTGCSCRLHFALVPIVMSDGDQRLFWGPGVRVMYPLCFKLMSREAEDYLQQEDLANQCQNHLCNSQSEGLWLGNPYSMLSKESITSGSWFRTQDPTLQCLHYLGSGSLEGM